MSNRKSTFRGCSIALKSQTRQATKRVKAATRIKSLSPIWTLKSSKKMSSLFLKKTSGQSREIKTLPKGATEKESLIYQRWYPTSKNLGKMTRRIARMPRQTSYCKTLKYLQRKSNLRKSWWTSLPLTVVLSRGPSSTKRQILCCLAKWKKTNVR